MGLSEWPAKFDDKPDDEFVEVSFPCSYEVVATSALAVGLGRFDEVVVWIPRSVIEGGDDYEEGDDAEVVMVAERYAEKEGLDY